MTEELLHPGTLDREKGRQQATWLVTKFGIAVSITSLAATKLERGCLATHQHFGVGFQYVTTKIILQRDLWQHENGALPF